MADLVGPRLYSCCNCRNHVSLHDDIISKAFQVRHLSLWRNTPNFLSFSFLSSSQIFTLLKKVKLLGEMPIWESICLQKGGELLKNWRRAMFCKLCSLLYASYWIKVLCPLLIRSIWGKQNFIYFSYFISFLTGVKFTTCQIRPSIV